MIFTFTNTEITLDTGTDLTSATVKVLYQKPDGSKGEWNAQVTSSTKVFYETETTDLDISGTWQFQAAVNLAGKILRGSKVKQTILNPIS